MIDNIQILRAVDERQLQMDGRPVHLNAQQLLNELSGAFAADPKLMPGFLQELLIARAAGQLTWCIHGREPNATDANYYLQQIQDLALTVAGQDRARGQVVLQPFPDPSEDDGHDLSDLILRRVASAITDEYASDQAETFLGEQGIPPDWLAFPEGTDPGDVHALLAGTWRAGSPGRGLVRQFMGRWLDGQLITGPNAELRATLIEQLARQGWQVRPEDSVLVAAEPVRGIPVGAAFLRATRLHPLIEVASRPQFLISKPDQGVFASMKAIEVRVRKVAGLGDELVGVDLMNRAFGPGGPLTDKSAPKREQEGTRALFAGAFAVLRNPAGHREVDYSDLSEAAEAVQLGSLLMRIVDRAEDRLAAAGRDAQAAG